MGLLLVLIYTVDIIQIKSTFKVLKPDTQKSFDRCFFIMVSIRCVNILFYYFVMASISKMVHIFLINTIIENHTIAIFGTPTIFLKSRPTVNRLTKYFSSFKFRYKFNFAWCQRMFWCDKYKSPLEPVLIKYHFWKR